MLITTLYLSRLIYPLNLQSARRPMEWARRMSLVMPETWILTKQRLRSITIYGIHP